MSFKCIVFASVGFAGMDGHYFFEFDERPDTDKLESFALEVAYTHAEMYGYYPRIDEEEDDDCYIDSIEGHAEEYNPEKHDMFSQSGTPDFRYTAL